MHRLLFLTVLILTAASVFAQVSFSVDTTYAEASHTSNAPVFYPWIELTNNTGALLEMRCVKVSAIKPPEWETWLEDLDSVYPYIPDTTAFFIPAVNEQAQYMIVSFHPHHVIGRATVVLKLYPVNDPSDSVLLTFQGNARRPNPTGINESDSWLPNVSLYPQPAGNILYISGQKVAEVHIIQLLNGIGQVIPGQWERKGEAIEVFTHGLPTGMYFLMLSNKQGKRTVMRWMKQ